MTDKGQYQDPHHAGMTLLHRAVTYHFTEAIPPLIEAIHAYKADLNETTYFSRLTALHIAVIFKHKDIVAMLINALRKAGKTLALKTADGKTAQNYALSDPAMAALFKKAPALPESMLGKRSMDHL